MFPLREDSPQVNLQRCGELTQSLVEIVHLRQYANDYNNSESICRRVRELIVPANVSLSAMPKALTDMTDTDPTVEQMDM
jgi:hypothetical protein